MNLNFDYKEAAAEYAVAQLLTLEPDSALTMTITRAKSGDYCVQTVTDESSEDTALQTAKFFSDTQVNT